MLKSIGKPTLSDAFCQLYCDPAVFEGCSSLHPVSFNRVLPFQVDDRVFDDPHVYSDNYFCVPPYLMVTEQAIPSKWKSTPGLCPNTA